MHSLAKLLSEHDLLALVLVIWLGLLLGRAKLLGVQMGAAGVLFAGLGVSAVLSPYATLKASSTLKEFGLVLFVYCVGLSSAAGFFRAFRHVGARWNSIVVFSLALGAALSVIIGRRLGLDAGQITGVFCGAMTNTPALAAATDRLLGTPYAQQPALGYSAAYPFGVLGSLLIFRTFAKLRKLRRRDQRSATSLSPARPPLLTRNFAVTNSEICFKALDDLDVRNRVGVVISRIHRAGEPTVPTGMSQLEPGDVIVAVGESDALERATSYFGAASDEQVQAHRDRVDMRRILVSRHELVGRTIAELDLDTRFNAQITRLRRTDVDMLASDATQIELGDRLRVVAPVEKLPEVSRFFGDSERELAEIDFVALAFGLSLGFVLAQTPLWPGTDLRLGIAGPLVVSLILGRLVRTGNFTWVLPYGTSNVLRHLGLLVFLASVGISSGSQLMALFGSEGLALAGLGAIVTVTVNLLVLGLILGPGRGNTPESLGACSGAMTQPATLIVARDLTGGSDDVYVAYSVVYPAAMIAKIVLAQLIAVSHWG